MSFVLLRPDLEMAAPALAPGIIVNYPDQRVSTPNVAALETGKLDFPKLKFT
jgi:hypothetical protein